MTLWQRIEQALGKRRMQESLRRLQACGADWIDFSSNDYLGIGRNRLFAQAVHEKWYSLEPFRLGATGSRLLSGTHEYMLYVEHRLAQLLGSGSVLLFNSGYQANVALLSTIPQRGDTILCDELIHASLREGARLSWAQRLYFRHNDLQHLEHCLKRAQGQRFVVVESIYSMDGDCAPLKALLDLCGAYGAWLLVDEAHSTGLWGEQGEGMLVAQGLHQHPALLARVYTFGKAIGGHGAAVAGQSLLIDYLVNFARPFIYTTALPLHSVVHIDLAFEWIAQNPDWQQRLWQNVSHYQQNQLKCQLPFKLRKSDGPIQVIEVGGNTATRRLASWLQQHKVDVRAVLAPTVPEGRERLRICLHTFNHTWEIDYLFDLLQHYAARSKTEPLTT